MAISIDWGTKVINIPQADLTSLGGSLYELDLEDFRTALNALQASEAGQPFPTTHNHNSTVTVAGVTLAQVIEIINGYTVTFEDGNYAVNLVGANSNVAEVTNINQVSIRSFNTAGMVTGTGGSGSISELDKLDIAAKVWDAATSDHTSAGTFGKTIQTIKALGSAILGLV